MVSIPLKPTSRLRRRKWLVVWGVVGGFFLASAAYRDRTSWAEPDRGFARAGLNLTSALPLVQQPSEDRPIRVLSLDAGGIRGIIELHVLVALEERTGQPISELFDLFVGTSTGSAITIGMLMGDENGDAVVAVGPLDSSPKRFLKSKASRQRSTSNARSSRT